MSKKKTFLGIAAVDERPPQPLEMRARILSFEIVERRVRVRAVGSEITIEPKPM